MKKFFRLILVLLYCVIMLCLSPASLAKNEAEIFLSEEPENTAKAKNDYEQLSFDEQEILGAARGIVINATNFPDALFRSYVSNFCDSNDDIVLTVEEIEAVTEIDVSGFGITNMKGLEYFSSLVTLKCAYNNLISLDLSRLPKLETLICMDNDLTLLDLSENSMLSYLYCWNNDLDTIDISSCPILVNTIKNGSRERYSDHISFFTNDSDISFTHGVGVITGDSAVGIPITDEFFLDRNLRQCIRIQLDKDFDNVLNDAEIDATEYFDCSGWQIGSLEGINCFHNLKYLYCRNNYLTDLDISSFRSLIELDCSYNAIGSLNIDRNPSMMRLRVVGNALGSLDLSNNQKLRVLWCWDNNIDKLDLLSCPFLSKLVQDGIKERYGGVPATNIDLVVVEPADDFDLVGPVDDPSVAQTQVGQEVIGGYISYFDRAETGDLSVDASVELITEEKPITIDDEHFPDNIFCQYVTRFDADKDGALDKTELNAVTEINCAGMEITSLDGINYFFALCSLNCSENKLDKLDISKCTSLTELNCSGNLLKTMNIWRNPALLTLNCSKNQLTSLLLKNNAAMTVLDCSKNDLSALSIIDCDSIADCIKTGNASSSIKDDIVVFSGNIEQDGISINITLSCDKSVQLITDLSSLGTPDFILPASLTNIDAEAFTGGAFIYVKLPDGVVSIGPRAFADCPNLAYIYIPAAVTDIDRTAFGDKQGLTIIGVPGSPAETYANNHSFTFIPSA